MTFSGQAGTDVADSYVDLNSKVTRACIVVHKEN